MVQPSRNLLAVVAAVATVGAALALYLRFEVGERDAFADRTAAAFDRPDRVVRGLDYYDQGPLIDVARRINRSR